MLRNVDVGTVQTEYSARMAMHTIEENHPTLPEGINLDDSDLCEEQKHEATQLVTKWESVFFKEFARHGSN